MQSLLSSSSSISAPGATMVFSTVGRPYYGFDVFSLSLLSTPFSEHRLTDGISVNFNAHFTDDSQSIVFISERTGSPRIYLTRPGSSSPPEELPSAPGSLFHDRPILKHDHDRVFFVSAHEPPHSLYNNWSAVYSAPAAAANAIHAPVSVTRLTPNDVVDYSPAISESGRFIAVASYGSKPWGGEFHELDTDIVVFPLSDPGKRTVVAKRGGWPTWCGDSTIYFHRESEDGWWSIYRVDSEGTESPLRVTPPGLHAFTPAAMNDGKRIAVATRRKDRPFRHIEIFHVDSGKLEPVTELLNPDLHHYNPFVSPGSKFLGYHRFRGESVPPPAQKFIPNLEPVSSPIKSLRMQRINGFFPSFSPDGKFIAYNHDLDANANVGLNVMKSDGSKRWTLIKGRVSFYNSWSPSSLFQNNKSVIYTSLGGIFQPAKVTVQIARVTFDPSTLDPTRQEVDNVEIKILTKEATGNNAFPACSPDGKWLVFRSGRSGHKNLYIMDAINGEFEQEGGSLRQLTEGEWIDTMPAWSPDGELIAFSSNRHNPSNEVTFGIYLVRPDGSGLRRVHVEGSSEKEIEMERINHVCFSPNGEWLLFTANMGGVTAEPISMPNQFQPYGDLFMVRLDGTALTRLTWNGYENGTPAWHSHSQSDDGVTPTDIAAAHCDCEELKKGQFQEPLWITCDF